MSLNIKLKRSAVSGSTPTAAQLEDGELGVNYNANDPAIYLKDSAGSVVRIAGENAAGGYWNLSGTTLSPSTSGDDVEIGGTVTTSKLLVNTNADTEGQVAASFYGASGGDNRGLEIKLGTAGTSPNALATLEAPQATNGSLAFATRSVERLRITGNNIYIGGTLPSAPTITLKSNGSAEYNGRVDSINDFEGTYNPTNSNQSETNFYAKNLNNSTDSRAAVGFSIGSSGTANGAINLVSEAGGNAASFAFQQRKTSGATGETLRIKSNGDVLVGGTLPSAAAISLNADGSYASPNYSIDSNGSVTITKSTTTDTFTIVRNGTDKVNIRSDGSATLAGDLTIAGRIQHSGDTNTAIRFPANDEVSIETNGNEAVRVDVNGSFGIGTPDPESRLHISGSVNSDIRQTNTSTDSLNHYADANRSAVNQTIFATKALWSGTEVARIEFKTGDDAVNKDNGKILFRTADTSGNVVARLGISSGGIASFRSNAGLQAEFGVLDGSYHNGENYTRIYGNGSSNYVQTKACNTADDTNAFEITINGINQAQIQADGDIQNVNGVYGQTSDERLKENIADAPSQWEDVKATKVRSFNFKEETGYSTHKQIGWVAQEVELVSPGCVSETASEDGEESTKSVKSSVLLIKAYKALQEAMERIETLEQRLDEVITE